MAIQCRYCRYESCQDANTAIVTIQQPILPAPTRFGEDKAIGLGQCIRMVSIGSFMVDKQEKETLLSKYKLNYEYTKWDLIKKLIRNYKARKRYRQKKKEEARGIRKG